MSKHLICVYLVIAIFVSCTSEPTPKKTDLSLYGMIYDRDNRPVNDARIYIDDTYRAISDIHGRFSIPKLKTGREYQIRAAKANHEEVWLDVNYLDPQDVLYINMYSAEQLLSGAEQALKDRDWLKTEFFLTRAEEAHCEYAALTYLRGILAFYKNDYSRALEILGSLAEQEKSLPYLDLFIADLHQYYSGDSEQALKYLKKFLEARENPEVQKRVRELEGS
ncbi:putative lipoprotein [Treponema primitia ZAS-2]|uniref:Putative lipoprotein n=1 Tax=Treponema primitia (strain ATCC BAA-887 / DSM 12427 / ZAS-2) TaxID=545694 RepID=F5YQQ4_TREPZ|nr:carboxypeptidase-like regulatory domain-containing protein [Treponema primitia]AEF84955.1 putative lipoprotein [Treponema primitia ZAS-2]